MDKTKVSIIVAMDEKRGIGKNNDLLFKIPEDGKRLRGLTTGHPLMMGRRTFESLGRLLPNRTHIVVTRDEKSLSHLGYKPHFVVGSVEEGIEVGKRVEKERLSNPPQPSFNKGGSLESEVFVFGGGQIYKEVLEKGLVDRLYLTIVKGDFGADTFFPEYKEFTKVIFRFHGKWEKYEYTFLDLEKGK